VHECKGCGLLQAVPALSRGTTARCVRCATILHRVPISGFDQSMALAIAALVLLVVMSSTAMMSVSTSGISHSAGLLSGPAELARRDMAELGLVVTFVTLIAPALRLGGIAYVLLNLRRTATPATHLVRVFAMTEKLRPWSMIEVFVFGIFVAYVKLGDLVHITLDPGVYALLALTCVMIWLDISLDREEVWNRIGLRENPPVTPLAVSQMGRQHLLACELCALVCVPAHEHPHCPRCGSALHERKPDSVNRTWALLIASVVLYVPANYYPVLTVVQLGSGQPSTILGGVEELLQARMYPLAALVFFASIAVPMLKMLGLAFMLISVQMGSGQWLRDRTKIFFIIHAIGRWSMIDIFMESLLGALVRFGAVVTIEPGIGAVAFCAVVILTMFAAETFDPRLMWDAAARKQPAPQPRSL